MIYAVTATRIRLTPFGSITTQVPAFELHRFPVCGGSSALSEHGHRILRGTSRSEPRVGQQFVIWCELHHPTSVEGRGHRPQHRSWPVVSSRGDTCR